MALPSSADRTPQYQSAVGTYEYMRILNKLGLATLIVAITTATALATPPPGTELTGTIQQTINTANAYVGEPVQLTNVRAPGANIHDATMSGTVTKVVRAGQGRAAQLRITLDRLTLGTGESYRVDGVVTGIKAVTKNNTVKEVAGAVAGMIVGNIIGKTVFHTNIGGLAGAAGGYLLAKNNRENMIVSSGSTVQVKLVTARRQASRP